MRKAARTPPLAMAPSGLAERNCLRELIESRARESPSAIAILSPGRRALTYGRLGTFVEEISLLLHRAGQAETPSPIGMSAGPRTPLEESVAATWKEVLRVERVGVADDFFALGGDSVLATQVVSRLRDALGVELPLLSFLEAPTVAGLAASVQRLLAGEKGEPVESPAESARP